MKTKEGNRLGTPSWQKDSAHCRLSAYEYKHAAGLFAVALTCKAQTRSCISQQAIWPEKWQAGLFFVKEARDVEILHKANARTLFVSRFFSLSLSFLLFLKQTHAIMTALLLFFFMLLFGLLQADEQQVLMGILDPPRRFIPPFTTEWIHVLEQIYNTLGGHSRASYKDDSCPVNLPAFDCEPFYWDHGHYPARDAQHLRPQVKEIMIIGARVS